jgi:hypothetical protein
MTVKQILTFSLLTVSVVAFGQNSKIPPRDESEKIPEQVRQRIKGNSKEQGQREIVGNSSS